MAFLGASGKLTRFDDFNRIAAWLDRRASATADASAARRKRPATAAAADRARAASTATADRPRAATTAESNE